MHRDQIGSLHKMTDADGKLMLSFGFDPFAGRRNPDWSASATADDYLGLLDELDTITNLTSRGFTGHEPLDRTGVIHMNGRIYDPVLGRFLNADPIVKSPDISQSHNRYSYVRNNPLSLIDPTGFEIDSPFVRFGFGTHSFAGSSNDCDFDCQQDKLPLGGHPPSDAVDNPADDNDDDGQGDTAQKVRTTFGEAVHSGLTDPWVVAGAQQGEIRRRIHSAVDPHFGKPFESQDGAAIYLHESLYDLSAELGIEIGARIYKYNDQYFISRPYTDFKADEVTSRPVPDLVPGGVAGNWHTHPAWNGRAPSNSDPDSFNIVRPDRQFRRSYISLRLNGIPILLKADELNTNWRPVQ